MHDFTLRTYRDFLSILKQKGYVFQSFRNFIEDPAPKCIILRHDVDARKMNSLVCARLENEMGIKGTYYFRIIPGSFDEKIITQICDLGHEIGYHYEDLALARGDKELAIKLFEEHLAKLRRVAPVETICMHGSPLSKYDNRKLWDKYNYRDYGLSGEPYLDTDFNQIMYLTDTGRRWDGGAVAIRDKAQSSGLRAQSKDTLKGFEIQRLVDNGRETSNLEPETRDLKQFHFHSTFDIISAARDNNLPDKIMLTVHPQRWENNMLPWLKELIWQNFKNIMKAQLLKNRSYER